MNRRLFIARLVGAYLGTEALETRKAWSKVAHVDALEVHYQKVAFRLQNLNLLMLDIKGNILGHTMPIKELGRMLDREMDDLVREMRVLRRYYR